MAPVSPSLATIPHFPLGAPSLPVWIELPTVGGANQWVPCPAPRERFTGRPQPRQIRGNPGSLGLLGSGRPFQPELEAACGHVHTSQDPRADPEESKAKRRGDSPVPAASQPIPQWLSSPLPVSGVSVTCHPEGCFYCGARFQRAKGGRSQGICDAKTPKSWS